jgi:hypothetical protein
MENGSFSAYYRAVFFGFRVYMWPTRFPNALLHLRDSGRQPGSKTIATLCCAPASCTRRSESTAGNIISWVHELLEQHPALIAD